MSREIRKGVEQASLEVLRKAEKKNPDAAPYYGICGQIPCGPGKSGTAKTITVDAVVSGLQHLAALNGVYTTLLETEPEACADAKEAEKLTYLAVFSDAGFPPGEVGKAAIREALRRAVETPVGMVYCRCRIERISPKEKEDMLALYAQASRTIREVAAIRELFSAEGYPVPGFLPEKTVRCFCHLKEKLSDGTLSQDVRERYGQCLKQLVREVHDRESAAGSEAQGK